jgi:hypothetical protein
MKVRKKGRREDEREEKGVEEGRRGEEEWKDKGRKMGRRREENLGQKGKVNFVMLEKRKLEVL